MVIHEKPCSVCGKPIFKVIRNGKTLIAEVDYGARGNWDFHMCKFVLENDNTKSI